MTKIDIYSGFLGAGKTTLIKKMLQESYAGEKIVLIENEFGEIGIDGGFLADAGVQISEMNSGCICCSLVGDFGKALKKVLADYAPDRIIIEPSGVGKLSDVVLAVRGAVADSVELNAFVTVADATKCKMYHKNFGEFYNNQIETANTVILSRTDGMSEDKLKVCTELIRELNPKATIVTTPWQELTGEQLRAAMEQRNTLEAELAELEAHAHHHGDDDEDEECECHHHHDHDEEHECHHHHDHDEEHECHHHHDHDEEHECHHHHHHADEVFTSWGKETPKKFGEDELAGALAAFSESDACGVILRAKGIVPCTDGTWLHFDYVPGMPDIRRGAAGVTGRLCVIGSKLNEEKIAELFGV